LSKKNNDLRKKISEIGHERANNKILKNAEVIVSPEGGGDFLLLACSWFVGHIFLFK
jgi:hypothetical protein